MKESFFKRLTGYLVVAAVILLSALFFTNDFGLVDLRKTSVIIGLGVDYEDEEIKLSAQLAVPRPAENGESTEFTVVEGTGATVADALDEINLKTGFYPKLVFCKLILVGESCFGYDVYAMLNYFFSNEFTGLTPKIASCEGDAGELLSRELPFGDSATDVIDRLLSDEAQKSANVSSANLKDFGQGYFSKSGSAYTPYIVTESDGEESEEAAEADSSQSGGATSGGGEDKNIRFDCGRTALYKKGRLLGIMDEGQAFAFNLLNGNIRRAFASCKVGEENKTLSIRNCKGGAELRIENGAPVVKISFSARCKLQDSTSEEDMSKLKSNVSEDVLAAVGQSIQSDMESMFEYSRSLGCDILGLQDMLFKKRYALYETLKNSVLANSSPVYEITLTSAN